ncbi:MAG: DoxX family protein [Prevotellaceae bacterium]|jgi:putative oxidoreductase|nr:DoxX family protein [Prevotellaceae bacterium]
MLYRFLFPRKANATATSLLLVVARLAFGILFMMHGIQKWSNFDILSADFFDPLGVGSKVSLMLAIFGELGCSLAFIFGFLYRLSMIPMMFTMCIAFFVVHAGDGMQTKELALVYLIVFALMYLAGPGKFSLDHWIDGWFSAKKRK